MMYQIAFFILLVLLVAGIFSRRNRQPRSSFCIDQDYCTTFSDFRHYDIVCIRNSLKRWTAMNSVCYWCFALYWTTSTLVLFSSDSMNTNTCGYNTDDSENENWNYSRDSKRDSNFEAVSRIFFETQGNLPHLSTKDRSGSKIGIPSFHHRTSRRQL